MNESKTVIYSDINNISPINIYSISKAFNMFVFAVVTIIVLILALGSLNTISARQTKLSESENDLRILQERITASVFLNLDSGVISDSSSVTSSVIDPKIIEKSYKESTARISQYKSAISDGNYPVLQPEGFTISFFELYGFYRLSTEMLLGILLISCGVLGSIMSTMRDGHGNPFKTIILGASVGFVALLGVKGGSTLFILTSAGVNVPFNAYSTAFAGVVAGMFSEKLYLALSNLTDKAFATGHSDNNQGR